ncbi:MAG: ATP-binding protein [Chitinophagales bacterium]
MLHTDPEQEPRFLEFEQLIKQRKEEALPMGFALLEQARAEGNKAIINFVNVHLANFYSDVQNRYQYAIDFTQAAADELDPAIDYEALGGYYVTIGRNYALLGNFNKCRDAYIKGKSLLEHKELSRKGKGRLGIVYQNLAALFIDLKLEKLADDFLQKAFEIFSETNDKARLCLTHNSLASRITDPAQKLYHFNTSIQYATETNNVVAAAVIQGNKGAWLCSKGDLEKGLENIKAAYESMSSLGHKRYQCDLAQHMGQAYSKMGKADLALQYFETAHNLFTESGAQFANYGLYRFWGDALRGQGKFSDALEKYDMHEKHREAMQDFNTSAAVTEAQLRFQLEEGKREAEMLQRKNKEIEEYAHLLELTNSELRQFTHVASHDLKEPLRMITNYSQLLEKSLNGKITNEQKEYINYLQQGGTRMMKVLKDLLLLSKINLSAGKEQVDLNNLVNALLFTLSDLITKNSAQITYTALPVITGDSEHLFQLFENLITNAIYHRNGNNPVVKISYSADSENHRFEIEDNGPGIAPEYREKVFVIFQRLHNRQDHEGNGIGLAICKKVVDSMKGKIWVEDAQLGGAKFVITLPLATTST